MSGEKLAELLEITSPQSRARTGEDRVLPVLPELQPLLPAGGLKAGTVTTVTEPGLLLALAAGPSALSPHLWTCVIGWPSIGLDAAAGYGLDLARLGLIDEPGELWPECLAAAASGFDLIIVQPPATPPPTMARRLEARIRQHRCVLLTLGPWPGAQLTLEVTAGRWYGLSDGHGMLTHRQVTARSSGRASPRPVTLELLLPNQTGGVTTLTGAAKQLPAPETPIRLRATAT